MENDYRVMFDGRLREGVDPEQFVHAFAQVFKVPEEQAHKLLAVSRPVALKDKLDQATAEKCRAIMEKLGMEVRLEQNGGLNLAADDGAAVAAAEPEPVSQPAPAAATGGPRCPKCGSDRVQGDDCLACGVIISRYRAKQAQVAAEGGDPQNPYAAPQSDVTPVRAEDDGSGMTGPHAVPVGAAWQWIVGGWRHLQRNPLAWIGALIIFYVLMIAIDFVPLVGPIVVGLLGPVIFAGFMLGANQQREGGDFRIGHLFAGFSANPGRLVQVGLLYGLGMLVIIGGAGVIAALTGALPVHGAHHDPRMSGRMASLILGAMVLTLPVLMAYVFAPALVALEGRGPLEAMKLSFSACLKNILPFLLYMVIALVLGVIAAIPLGLGMLVFLPVMIAAVYTAYRDIFYQSASI